MENYVKSNKKAWEEAFEKSSENFKRTLDIDKLKKPKEYFSEILDRWLKEAAEHQGTLGQFCCNNGRETLASLSYGFSHVQGFDIAENMIDSATKFAVKHQLNATFHACNLLEIEPSYHQRYDVGLFTVGALCWFENLQDVFKKIAETVKSGGLLIIEDMHPLGNMLASQFEEQYNADYPKLLVYDYFKKDPWIEGGGMGYMTEDNYDSEMFYSYSHTLSDILNAIIEAGFVIEELQETPICHGNLFTHLNHQNVPLTYALKARKK